MALGIVGTIDNPRQELERHVLHRAHIDRAVI